MVPSLHLKVILGCRSKERKKNGEKILENYSTFLRRTKVCFSLTESGHGLFKFLTNTSATTLKMSGHREGDCESRRLCCR